MRHLVGFVLAVVMVASPRSVSAQDPGPAAGELALQLELDDAGVSVSSSPPRTPDSYTLDRMKRRVMRAKIGIGASALSLIVGGILAGVSVPYLSCTSDGLGRGDCPNPSWALPVFVTGLTLAGGGVLGNVATGALLGVRKRKLRNLEQAHHARPRRVQWDLARSRLVF